MTQHNTVLDAVLAGEQLQVRSDWNLAVNLLAVRTEEWAGANIFTTDDAVWRSAIVQEALVIIEIMERLDCMATDVFAFEPDNNMVWQSLQRVSVKMFKAYLDVMCRRFGISLADFEALIQQHFEKVGFTPREK